MAVAVGVGAARARLVLAAEHAAGAERRDRAGGQERRREREEQRDSAPPRPAGRADGLRRLGRGDGRRCRAGAAAAGKAAVSDGGRPRGRCVRGARRLLQRVAGGDAAGGRGRDLALERRQSCAREVARRRVALLRRLRHRGADHDVEAGRDAGGERACRRRGIVEVRVHLRQLGVARERHAAGERVEEDGAQRVHVGARVRVLAADLLGRCEVRRTDETAGAGEAAAHRLALGQPEVGEVRVLLPILRDQHVRRLDVAVHEPAPVRGVERAGDLPDDVHGALGIQALGGVDQRPQVRAVDVAHREVEDAVGLAGLEDRHDVGVIDRRGELRLGLEALAEVGIVRVLRGNHLQRDRTPEPELGGAVHDAHAAVACDAVDAIVTERRTGLQVRNGGVHVPTTPGSECYSRRPAKLVAEAPA